MRFEDAYEGWQNKRLTQIDAVQLLARYSAQGQALTEDLSVAA